MLTEKEHLERTVSSQNKQLGALREEKRWLDGRLSSSKLRCMMLQRPIWALLHIA
jgi:hypothetical protein